MRANGLAVSTWNIVDVALDGLGTIRNDSAGTSSGESVRGLFYVAPSPLPPTATTVRVTVIARDVETQETTSSTVELGLGAAALSLAMVATPALLSQPGAVSEVCATFRDGGVPVDGARDAGLCGTRGYVAGVRDRTTRW